MFDRRSFLKTACTSAAAVAVSNRFTAFAQPASASGIQAFVTDPKRRHESLPLIGWSSTSKSGDKEEIIVDESVRHQPLLGFGAAFTDASCFLLSTMPPQTRQKVMNDFFSPAELNLSVGRCCVGSSDYSRDVYSYDDVAGDMALEHFSIAHDEAYILPTLRDAGKINRDLFLLASPWSPPGWMKTYGSMLGGWMSAKYLDPYARYLAQFVAGLCQGGREDSCADFAK